MFGKKKEEAEFVTEVDIAVETEPEKAPVEAPKETIIAAGFKFKGDVETTQPLTILGTLEGDILSSSDFYVAKGAVYIGNACVKNFKLEGSAKGTLNVQELTTLASDCSFDGSLNTFKIYAEEGASFDGELKLNPEKKSAAEPVKSGRIDEIVDVTEYTIESLDSSEDRPVTEADIFG